MRIIGIDYGKARIGLAVTDGRQTMALPLTTVAAGKNIDASVENILSSIKEYLPETEKILVGLPLLMSGEKGAMARIVEAFAEKLKKKLNLPLILYDERLTSAAADDILKEMNLSRKKRAKKMDVTAATLILRNYLEESMFTTRVKQKTN